MCTYFWHAYVYMQIQFKEMNFSALLTRCRHNILSLACFESFGPKHLHLQTSELMGLHTLCTGADTEDSGGHLYYMHLLGSHACFIVLSDLLIKQVQIKLIEFRGGDVTLTHTWGLLV